MSIERELAAVERLRIGSGGSPDDPNTGDKWYRAQIVAYRKALAHHREAVAELRPEDHGQGTMAMACECGHPVAEHAWSGWGENTVCVEPLADENAGWYGVCPCVRHGDEEAQPMAADERATLAKAKFITRDAWDSAAHDGNYEPLRERYEQEIADLRREVGLLREVCRANGWPVERAR